MTEKVPSMSEVIRRGESETVKKAREVFRSSLVMGIEGILGYDNLSHLEAWFINKALESYRRSMGGGRFLENGLTILDASAWIAGLEFYERSMIEVVYGDIASWRVRRAEATLRRLKSQIVAAEITIEEYPEKLVRLKTFNEKVAKIVDRRIRPMVNGIGEGLGAIPAFGVMVIGVTAGAVGFASGRAARSSLELAKAKVVALLASLGKGGEI